MDQDTGQTLMSGMGLLHLEVKQHRMERDDRLKIKVGKPRVSYRETMRRPVKVEGECVRQAGTTGLFAKVTVAFEPTKGTPTTVVNQIPPETLPAEWVAAAEQGIRGALQSGELGYPVIDVKATLLAGEMDEQLSNDIAFQAAGSDAVNKRSRKHGAAGAGDGGRGDGAGRIPGAGDGGHESTASGDHGDERARQTERD